MYWWASTLDNTPPQCFTALSCELNNISFQDTKCFPPCTVATLRYCQQACRAGSAGPPPPPPPHGSPPPPWCGVVVGCFPPLVSPLPVENRDQRYLI